MQTLWYDFLLTKLLGALCESNEMLNISLVKLQEQNGNQVTNNTKCLAFSKQSKPRNKRNLQPLTASL